MKKFKNLY
jgi:RNA-directed DNA polymerase